MTSSKHKGFAGLSSLTSSNETNDAKLSQDTSDLVQTSDIAMDTTSDHTPSSSSEPDATSSKQNNKGFAGLSSLTSSNKQTDAKLSQDTSDLVQTSNSTKDTTSDNTPSSPSTNSQNSLNQQQQSGSDNLFGIFAIGTIIIISVVLMVVYYKISLIQPSSQSKDVYQTTYQQADKVDPQEFDSFNIYDVDINENSNILTYSEAEYCYKLQVNVSIFWLMLDFVNKTYSIKGLAEFKKSDDDDYYISPLLDYSYSFDPMSEKCFTSRYYKKDMDLIMAKNMYDFHKQAIDEYKNFVSYTLKHVPKIITSKEQIKKAQTLLNFLGFATGKPDGVFGLKTSKAIVAFQTHFSKVVKDTPMPISGIVSDQLLEALYNCMSNPKCYVNQK